MSFERIKCDSVDCVTHSVNIPIKDTKLLAKHCTAECVLDWPLKAGIEAETLSGPFGIIFPIFLSSTPQFPNGHSSTQPQLELGVSK